MTDTAVRARVGAVVLAAGTGTRFGGPKLGVTLDGRPILQHVLDAIGALAPGCCVVVLGADAERLEAIIRWRDEARVRNPEPAAGLSGSLRLGVAECRRLLPDAAGVLVVLGDQPRVSSGVMRALVDAMTAARAQDAWAVIPHYAAGGGANPVLLLPEGMARVPEVRGDRGLGPLLAADPRRAFRVSVPGSNPDVDTRADLAALSEASASEADRR